jgi:hypothetical protein
MADELAGLQKPLGGSITAASFIAAQNLPSQELKPKFQS